MVLTWPRRPCYLAGPGVRGTWLAKGSVLPDWPRGVCLIDFMVCQYGNCMCSRLVASQSNSASTSTMLQRRFLPTIIEPWRAKKKTICSWTPVPIDRLHCRTRFHQSTGQTMIMWALFLILVKVLSILCPFIWFVFYTRLQWNPFNAALKEQYRFHDIRQSWF